MADRTVRNLEFLAETASTSRVLNLHALYRRKKHLAEYREQPLFQAEPLNTAIILKHRVRANETELFPISRKAATKIMAPIERDDLKLGARYVFVGQRRFKDALFETFGLDLKDDGRDLKTLQIMDETPSLDPFVLREQLRRHGLEPAQCYFDLSEADGRRMFNFAQSEIQPLVRMSLGDGALDPALAAKLTTKILANSADRELEPLRLTLQLDKREYLEGVFCWKAFLYYKWQLAELLPRMAEVMRQIEHVRPVGPQTDELKTSLQESREHLQKAVIAACRAVKKTLGVYDGAYHCLTDNGQPLEFRNFLLKAPAMFAELGEQLGAVEHIVSFWRFRFPSEKKPSISPEDLADIFMDFEGSLNIQPVAGSVLPTPDIIAA